MNKLIVFVAALCVIAVGWGFYVQFPKENTMTPVVVEDDGVLVLALGQEGGELGVTLKPLGTLEDSRCPLDVQCIQAGTVRLEATMTSGLGSATQVFRLGETITTEAEEVTLESVAPAPRATAPIELSDYRFTFKIEKR